jgi:antitoxin PrlF
MNRTRVTERGQVTIPKALRERLGIVPGTEIEFEAEAGRLIGRKADSQAPIDRWYGTLQVAESTDEFMDAIRGPVELPPDHGS